jgi:ATP-dependent RNA helicase DeaD
MLYKDMPLKAGLLKSIAHAKYKQATPIQEQVIQPALEGHNIVGQSQTGTGKTAAFLIPVLQRIDTNKKSIQALIIAPTRELVTQIHEEIRTLTKYYGVTSACVYGGASPNVQKKHLAKQPAIVVATPGRLMDFMKQKVIDLRSVEYFILDEVDRMLDMGFVRDITRIRSGLRNLQQTYTFSATMSPEIKKIISSHIPKHVFVKVGEEVTVDAIDHTYVAVNHEDKITTLLQLIHEHTGEKIIVFTHTKRNTKTIQAILEKAGVASGRLNGNMSQAARQRNLKSFKNQEIQVMVTTDVAARGLNMDNVGLVVNFDVPVDAQSYVHRIGRTGRAGASGKALMFVSPLERPLLSSIERAHDIRIDESHHLATPDIQ